MDRKEAIVHNPGVFSGISSLFKSLFGLAVSRVELAALELSEIRNHIIELLAIFAAAVLVTKGLALLKQNKLAFPATMKELKNDREMLL